MTARRSAVDRAGNVLREAGRAARRAPTGIVRLARLPAGERSITVRAFVTLVLVELTIRWVPVPRLARVLGVSVSEASRSADRRRDPVEEQRALRAVQRIVRRWPFGTGPCLRESLVLGSLLRQQGPVLRFGVARHRSRIMGHAWIEVAGSPINDPQGVTPLRGVELP